jgi:H-type lectin domain-containing protein
MRKGSIMKIFHATSAALIAALLSTSAAAQQRTQMASQSATESTAVNHAEGGSVSMQYSGSNACPAGPSGQRLQVFPIRFQRPFTNNAYVATVGLSTADVDQSRNFRLGASIENKTRDGMTIVTRTWCNTVIHSATFNYSAVGR